MLNCLFVRHDNVARQEAIQSNISHHHKGWFYGLKLHVLIDRKGNLMNAKFTTGKDSDISVLERLISFFRNLGWKQRVSVIPVTSKTSWKRSRISHWNHSKYEKYVNAFISKITSKKTLNYRNCGHLKDVFMIEHHQHRSPTFILVISTLSLLIN